MCRLSRPADVILAVSWSRRECFVVFTGPPLDRFYITYTSALLKSLQWRRTIARSYQLLTLNLLRLTVRDAERCLNIRGSRRQVVVPDFLLDLRPPR